MFGLSGVLEECEELIETRTRDLSIHHASLGRQSNHHRSRLQVLIKLGPCFLKARCATLKPHAPPRQRPTFDSPCCRRTSVPESTKFVILREYLQPDPPKPIQSLCMAEAVRIKVKPLHVWMKSEAHMKRSELSVDLPQELQPLD